MRTPRRFMKVRRGYALLSAITMAVLFLLMGTAMLALAGSNLRNSYRRLHAAHALNVAMGVLEDGIERRRQSGTYTGASTFAVPGTNANGRIIVQNVFGSPTQVQVIGEATVDGGMYTVTRQVRTTLDRELVAGVFKKALAAKNNFEINGTVNIESAPVTGQGDVHTNGDLLLIGTSVNIQGEGTASGNVSTSGSPTVSGGITAGAPPMLFPEVDAAYKIQSVANGVTVGNTTIDDGSTLQGKIVGNLRVNEPDGCVLNGIVWVTGTVTIEGPVKGTGTIVCDGDISIDARRTDADTDVSAVAFITTSTSSSAVDIGGNRQFKGLVYAPYGNVRFRGTPSIYGQVFANTMEFSGTPSIVAYVNIGDSPPPLPPVLAIKGWEEL